MKLVPAGVVLSESDVGRRVKNSLNEFGTVTSFNDSTSEFSITYLGEFIEKCVYTGKLQKAMKNYIVTVSLIGKTIKRSERNSEVVCFI